MHLSTKRSAGASKVAYIGAPSTRCSRRGVLSTTTGHSTNLSSCGSRSPRNRTRWLRWRSTTTGYAESHQFEWAKGAVPRPSAAAAALILQ